MRLQLATVCVLLAMIVGCEEKAPLDPTPQTPQVRGDLDGALSASSGSGAVGAEAAASPQSATLPKVTAEAFRKVISDTTAQGKVVVVDVWATWCVPCVENFPAIHKGIDELGDDVVLITLTIDGPEDEQRAIKFLQSQHAMANAYMAPASDDELLKFQQTLGEQWDSLVVPALFVYGSDDKIASEYLGDFAPSQVIDGAAQALAANK